MWKRLLAWLRPSPPAIEEDPDYLVLANLIVHREEASRYAEILERTGCDTYEQLIDLAIYTLEADLFIEDLSSGTVGPQDN